MNVPVSNNETEKDRLTQSENQSGSKKSCWGRCFRCLKIEKCQCNKGCFKFLSFFNFSGCFKSAQQPIDHHEVEKLNENSEKPELIRQREIYSINHDSREPEESEKKPVLVRQEGICSIYNDSTEAEGIDKKPELKRQFSIMDILQMNKSQENFPTDATTSNLD